MALNKNSPSTGMTEARGNLPPKGSLKSSFNKKNGALAAILAIVPAAAAFYMPLPAASGAQGPQGAAHVQQYEAQISRISIDASRLQARLDSTHPRVGTPEMQRIYDAQNAIEARAYDLAANLATDQQISERDAGRLAGEFLEKVQSPQFSQIVHDTFTGMKADAAFLENARNGDAIKAGYYYIDKKLETSVIIEDAHNKHERQGYINAAIGWAAGFGLISLAMAAGLLRFGRNGGGPGNNAGGGNGPGITDGRKASPLLPQSPAGGAKALPAPKQPQLPGPKGNLPAKR